MSSIHLRKARAVRLLLLAFAAAAVSGCNPTQAQGGPGGPPPVSVAPAVQRSLQNSEEFSARIEAQATVELRSRVAGTVERVHFKEGQRVAKGALLFTIDPKAVRRRSRARTGTAGEHAHASRAGEGRARARREAAADAGRVGAGSRSTARRRAQRASGREISTRSVEHGAALARLCAHHGAGGRPHLARQHHAGQSGRCRRSGADNHRRQRHGASVVRRQRVELPQDLAGDARRRRGADGGGGPVERRRLPAHRHGGLRRQPAQSRHRQHPRARDSWTTRKAASRRACPHACV